MEDEEDTMFEKFMVDVCRREDAAKQRAETISNDRSDEPQRRRNALYRERWQNRVVWRRDQ